MNIRSELNLGMKFHMSIFFIQISERLLELSHVQMLKHFNAFQIVCMTLHTLQKLVMKLVVFSRINQKF